MGRAKHAWLEDQENLTMAAGYLVQWGVLKSCEIHGYLHDGDGDLQKAYKFGNAGINKGTISLPSDMSRSEFSDLLKRAYDEHSGAESCYGCDKNAED